MTVLEKIFFGVETLLYSLLLWKENTKGNPTVIKVIMTVIGIHIWHNIKYAVNYNYCIIHNV